MKKLILLAVLTLFGSSLKAQWTPCTPCSPNPCLQGTLENSTDCIITWEILFPGNPQCSPNLILGVPASTPSSIPFAISCHKCIDGPCSCPIGLKLLDPNDPTIVLGTVLLPNPFYTGTSTYTYSTSSSSCNTLTVDYTFSPANSLKINVR